MGVGHRKTRPLSDGDACRGETELQLVEVPIFVFESSTYLYTYDQRELPSVQWFLSPYYNQHFRKQSEKQAENRASWGWRK